MSLLPPPLAVIGGMELATRHQRGTSGSPTTVFHDVFRTGANDWGLVIGAFEEGTTGREARAAEIRTMIRTCAAANVRPSAVLGDLSARLLGDDPENRLGRLSLVLFGRLELDVGGAWVTLAIAGEPRPIAVRQAGWIDVRGDVGSPPGSALVIAPGDDRVGLGPGDALVLCSCGIVDVRDSNGDPYGEEAFPELLLDSVGQSAAEIASRTVAGAVTFGGGRLQDDGAVLVVRVPEIERGGALKRVARATGLPAAELDLPLYPAGDVQTDLWRSRPQPRREARINLAPEPRSVPALRRLLRRLLQSWRMAEAAESDLELVATEVATNVFATASSTVTVIVRYDGRAVRVEIGDGARERPRRTVPGYDELTGPGLLLVDALSSDWGVVRTRAGRRVWFEVPAAEQTGPGPGGRQREPAGS